MRLLTASVAAFLVSVPVLAEQGDAEDRALIQSHVEHPPANEHRASKPTESSTPAQEHPASASAPKALR
ncbi:hypothetical protein BJG93_35030 [Paraburkholderia sprentiae WSM5005]|uniref:DUF4148 domain-containing protein n=1 Tax=Paraburkholderia sprentiae WSM5005 TaxID=754502 RepID=A0A8F4KI90_9BURK|nr:hypothetical protein [Paraburkholderia sprentiae]QXE07168.1 hypothetical protein BJG93_35030 [Paraburkholderia sprentiae WSM5005]